LHVGVRYDDNVLDDFGEASEQRRSREGKAPSSGAVARSRKPQLPADVRAFHKVLDAVTPT
jgi:hypothetical protein